MEQKQNEPAGEKAKNPPKLAIYFPPDERQALERWSKAGDCRSLSDFVREAVRFYIDYLKVGEPNVFLPIAVGSAIDGKLGGFENRLGQLLYKQAVELEMLKIICADVVNCPQEDLQAIRREAEQNVKRTNGGIAFEKIMKQEDDLSQG